MAREKASRGKSRDAKPRGRAASREKTREKSSKEKQAKGAPWGSMKGSTKKAPKLNPDKLSAAKARAKKNAEAARMAEEFAYAVKAAGMFGASASETAAELEAMQAKAKQAEREAKAAVMEAAPAEDATQTAETSYTTEATPSTEAVQGADDIPADATAATEETEEEPETPSVTFRDLGLNSYIIKAISEMGFEKPTPVQARIIPTLLSEEGDVVCLAQTGTGKTAAFGLPSLERIVAHNMERYTQVLVLSPTRELCRQITQDLRNYSKHLHDLQIVDVYGGAGIEPQIKALKKIPHIVVATPGRLLDLIGRKATDLSQVHTLILDEADEMLNMGFKEELDAILESLPQEKRVLLFSATLPIEVEKIAKT